MSFVTFLWSTNAAAALMLALVCALLWAADRRDLAKLMFCVTALATAAATPLELGMMRATAPDEFGQALRWYHVPIFFTLVGQLLFVRFYLGTGRAWIVWTFISARLVVLTANFVVQPNFHFREITSLGHLSFLGEQVSVVGDTVGRSWQWFATATMLLLIVFVLDAAAQAWRGNSGDSRRKGLTVVLAIVVPMIVNLTVNQLVVFGVLHVPICATLWFLGTLTVIAYELGRELIGNGRARLQLAEVRSEWAQTERVNALGHLASALAHELGQPLSATQTNAFAARSLLKKAHPDLDELRAIVDDIETESKRASDIIHRMRTLIRRRCVELQPLDMTDVVHEVLGLLRHEAASRRISLKLNLAHDLPLASGDRVHVSQVLINLLLNGMDAVRDRPPEARLVRVDARPDAGAIQIAVEDSGLGMPEDRFEEVFTSFYTTKPTGMGVGLSLSRMIVEAHSGRLWAENSASGGAIFRFTLPMATHAAQ